MKACLVFIPHVCLAMSLLAARANACAPASRGGPVRIATESALIIWDEKTKTQHFIRRALFETHASDFGFLVPTPTQPELAEAPDELFGQLEEWTKPETRIEKYYDSGGCESPPPHRNIESVAVLAQQHVAGYDAVVLKADDAEAMREWLLKHEYDARPELT